MKGDASIKDFLERKYYCFLNLKMGTKYPSESSAMKAIYE